VRPTVLAHLSGGGGAVMSPAMLLAVLHCFFVPFLSVSWRHLVVA
jgi:hypothetical protein